MTDYWIKLYIEIIDDPKMATLPDRLWRRVIELFLLAGKMGDNGMLPNTTQLAWMLRMPTDDLELDIQQLTNTGIVQAIPNGWIIPKFSERQAPSSATERMRQFRKKEQTRQYYGDEVVTNRNNRVTQINRLTDNRLTETEAEARASAATPAKTHITTLTVPGVLMRAAGLSAIPPSEMARVEQITCLLETHGPDRVEAALKDAAQRWRTTRGKTGRPYPVTNMAWVDWAQSELDGQQGGTNVTRATWESWTDNQKQSFIDAGGEMPL